jgi:dolichol-phosphate mannosyltransferase
MTLYVCARGCQVIMRKPLAVVMPVYNENECIAQSVTEWLAVLNGLSLDFEIYILDDGSTDGTYATLEKFRSNDRIKIIHQSNRGHGPTILAGYLLTCEGFDWIFQTDSDMELEASHFVQFWLKRENYDALFGVRVNRRQGIARRLISAISRSSIQYLYAPGVKDANVPYRLMRSQILKPIISRLSTDSFAPNVIISGALSLMGVRILNIPIPFNQRKTGSPSHVSFQFFAGAFRSLLQLVFFRWRFHGNRRFHVF